MSCFAVTQCEKAVALENLTAEQLAQYGRKISERGSRVLSDYFSRNAEELADMK